MRTTRAAPASSTALMDVRGAGSASIVVTLRADFYGRCANHPRLAAAVAEQQHLLGPMQIDELRRAIEGPARAAGLRLQDGLVDAMLADVEGEPGALPLLSHALFEIVGPPRRSGADAGGLPRCGRCARGDRAHGRRGLRGLQPSTSRQLMRRMFLQLTELGETTEDTRRRVPLAELTPGGRCRRGGDRGARAAGGRPAPGRGRTTRPRSPTRR